MKPAYRQADKTVKSEIITAVQQAFPSMRKDIVEELVRVTIETMANSIAGSKITYLSPIGTFKWVTTKATKRQLFGGEIIDVPAKKRIRFKASE